MASFAWWAGKARQFRSHLLARVAHSERVALAGWLSPSQLNVFDSMHRADRRHGLDVVATLRREGVSDMDVLMAGLLHDAGKGPQVGVWPRVAWSLGAAYGPRVTRLARILPGFTEALRRLDEHAEVSAKLAAEAGCSARTVELIRWQAEPRDAEFGELLRVADEAN